MNIKEAFKKYCPYLVAAVLFIALAYIYCSPVLKGKVLYAGDIQNYVGASNESRQYHNTTGDYTFWNGAMFCGMPNYQIGGGRYKSDDLLNPIKNVLNHRGNPVLMIFFYFICFFILLRAFGINRWMSIAGALAIGLSSYFIVIIPAGHFTKVSTIAFASVTIGGFYLTFRKKYALGAILTMLFVAISFKTHPQMFYYICMMLGLLWLAELYQHIKERKYGDFALSTCIFALSVLVGVGTGASNVFANSEYVSETMRGGHSDIVAEKAEKPESKGLDIEYATQWSYGIDESMSFLIPGFMGGASSVDVGKDSKLYKTLVNKGISPKSAGDFCAGVPMYWGDQPFTSGNVYMGAIICFLFLLGLLIVKGPYKWAILAATVLSTALAWGHNCMWLTELFFKYFPLYSKFRAVSSILIVAEISMPLLGFLALKQIAEGKVEKEKLFKNLYIAGGVSAGLCLFFAILGGSLFSFTSQYDASWSGSLPDWLYAAIIEQRASLMRSDSFRSFLFILGGFVAVWLYAKGKIKEGLMTVLLGALILADMWPVDRRYFNDGNFVTPKKNFSNFTMQPYETEILKDKSYFRVFNLASNTFNDARTSYWLKSLGGYSAAKLRRYQDLIDQHLSKMHVPVINMLNAKYIITPGKDGQPAVQLNPDAFGNAWFVDKLKIVENANEESDALNTLDLRHEAVLDKSFAQYVFNANPSVPEDASVVLNKYTPKELDYTSSSSRDGTIVFSEIYYPYGWKASIDGKPAEHYRVNYMLRALNVPAGVHNIHFIFDPDSVRKGDAIATACILLMYLLSLGIIIKGIYMSIKRKNA